MRWVGGLVEHGVDAHCQESKEPRQDHPRTDGCSSRRTHINSTQRDYHNVFLRVNGSSIISHNHQTKNARDTAAQQQQLAGFLQRPTNDIPSSKARALPRVVLLHTMPTVYLAR